jgi:hypothetical protein
VTPREASGVTPFATSSSNLSLNLLETKST